MDTSKCFENVHCCQDECPNKQFFEDSIMIDLEITMDVFENCMNCQWNTGNCKDCKFYGQQQCSLELPLTEHDL